MQSASRTRKGWLAIVLASVGVGVLGGCGGSSTVPGVVAVRVGALVREPEWSEHARALFALTEDGRVARIDPSGQPSAARTTVSAPFPHVGENLVTRVTTGVVYLPEPQLDRVALLSDTDLHQIGAVAAGPAPSFLALDSGADDLLALSKDHTTATPVDLHDNTVLPSQTLSAGAEAELDGAKRGRLIDYYVTGPGGITHYQGSPGSVQIEGRLGISAERTAGDLTKPSRLYVAEKDTDRLLAVDSTRSLTGLEVVGQASLGESAHYVGVDETRIYAATEHTLVVLQTNTYEGYPNNTIPIVETIEYRASLPSETLKDAPLSGLAVGPDQVYLTLKDQPYIVSIAKPKL